MDDFLKEFHQRRREEAVAEHGVSVWWNRFTSWLSEPGASKWAYGAGLAYATILVAVMVVPQPQESGAGLEQIDHRVVVPFEPDPPAVQQLEELDLRPNSAGKMGEQEF